MEEIKVGEYVRSEIGSFGKVTRIEDGKFLYEDKTLITWIGKVKKHSPNIIDLIEVGDYVNGEKVIYIDNLTGSLRQYNVAGEDIEKDCGHWQEDIESVVTHEQFNSIKYEVI